MYYIHVFMYQTVLYYTSCTIFPVHLSVCDRQYENVPCIMTHV